MTDDEIAALSRQLTEASNALFRPHEHADEAPVDLDPDIYTVTTDTGLVLAVSPPFIHSLYTGERENRLLNAQLALKRALYDKDVHAGKWSAVLFAISQRPYRAEVLYELGIEREVMPPRDFWQMAGEVWTDSENCYQNLDLWREIFTCDLPFRERLMTSAERDIFDDLPDPIPVWHGVDGSEFAWTTDRGVAEWFARRFPHKADRFLLREGLAPKDKVIAYFDRRNEKEVLILREDVQDEREFEIPPKPIEADKPSLAKAIRTMDHFKVS